MSLTQQILDNLPATLPELCAVLEKPTSQVNGMLQYLRKKGKAIRIQKEGIWSQLRGPKPHLWVRVEQ